MKIVLAYPRLPPFIDGIGDYTASLAAQLALGEQVVIAAAGEGAVVPEGVSVEYCLSDDLRDYQALDRLLAEQEVDWLVLQYSPFSWGRRGFNLALPSYVRRLSKSRKRTRIALMVHEPFVPFTTPQFMVMSLWQRPQLRLLGAASDVIFCSTEANVRHVSAWFPRARVVHLPVGSNIPTPAALGGFGPARPPTDKLTIGMFGSSHPGRMPELFQQTIRQVCEAVPSTRVLCIGTGSAAIVSGLAGIDVEATGSISASEVSRHIERVDLALLPFVDGVSTRRTTFMAMLQRGVCTLTTLGDNTDALLEQHAGNAFAATPVDAWQYVQEALSLATDIDRRQQLGQSGRHLFDRNFTWEIIAARMMEVLRAP